MVSVIITTFGGSPKLDRAIRSVLSQKYDNFEVIVVDDNNPSTPQRSSTEKLMKKYQNTPNVKYIKHDSNKNGAAARNTGFSKAKGDYIAYLDDDDIYTPNRLQDAVNALKKDLTAVAICFSVACINGKLIDLIIQKENHETISAKDFLINQMVIGSGSNIFVRRHAIEELAGFDERFSRYQDIEFMIRVAGLGKIICMPEITIIKDGSDVRVPNYNSVKNATYLFNETFRSLLSELDEKEKNIYCFEKALSLWNLAKLSRNLDYINESAERLKEYGDLSVFDSFGLKHLNIFILYLKLKYKMKFGCFCHIYQLLKRIKSIRNDYHYKCILSNDTYREIKHYIN